jgi:hypothetical protein
MWWWWGGGGDKEIKIGKERKGETGEGETHLFAVFEPRRRVVFLACRYPSCHLLCPHDVVDELGVVDQLAQGSDRAEDAAVLACRFEGHDKEEGNTFSCQH